MNGTDAERDLLATLGLLLIHANYVDEALVDLYWTVARKSEPDLIVAVRGKTLGGLVKAVCDTYTDTITDGALLERLERLRPLLDDALQVRNDYVHAYYVFTGGPSLDRTRRPKKGATVEVLKNVQVTDLESAIETLGAAQEAILDLYDATVEHVPGRDLSPRAAWSLRTASAPCARWAISDY
ncbi:MAG: hypothetical protein IPL61_12210 [Myxococcales bacterium]|nr:hypothetical protein [Myxococcales bacterium]